MTFLTPGFLVAGAVAATVPLIIFLLWRHRRSPVRWAAMRFVLEAERLHQARRRIERWLLLLLRCAALVLLGLALARPQIGAGGLGSAGRRSVIVVIDDGMTASLASPRADGSAGTVLDGHRSAARDLLDGVEPGVRIGFVAASRQSVDLLPPTSDTDTARRWLANLAVRPVPADLPSAIREAGRAATLDLADGRQPEIRVLSEFRVGSADLEETLSDLSLPATVPLAATSPAASLRSNVTVAGIEPVRTVIIPGAADGSNQVSVRLVRHGELDEATTTLRLSAPGLTGIDPRTVSWSPGERRTSVEFRLPVDPGESSSIALTAAVDGDDLPVDDERSIVLETRSALRVAVIGRSGFGDRTIDRLSAVDWLVRALRPAEGAGIEIARFEPATLNGTDLRSVEMAMVPSPDLLRPSGWEALAAFAARGGTVMVSPPDDADVHQWADAFIESFGLDWRIDRGTDILASPLGVANPRTTPAMLSMLSGDLEDLLRPVFVERRLRVELDAAADVILETEDGLPLLAAAWTGSLETAEAAGDALRRETVRTPASGDDEIDDEDERSDGLGGGEVRGLVLLLTVAPSLDWTNLPSKPFMVPLVHETVRQGVGMVRRNGTFAVATRPRLTRFPAADRLRPSLAAAAAASASGAETGETTGGISRPTGSLTVGGDGRPVEPIPAPGVYEVLDAAGTEIGAVAAAVRSAGGRTAVQTPEAVAAWLARSGEWALEDSANASGAGLAAEARAGIAVPLLAALGLLLLAETLLARRFSHLVEGRGIGGAAKGSLLPTLTIQNLGGSGAGQTGSAASAADRPAASVSQPANPLRSTAASGASAR